MVKDAMEPMQVGANQQQTQHPAPPGSTDSQGCAKFSFAYDNPRFSDAVLLLRTHACTPAPLAQRVLSTAAHLWLSITSHAVSAAWTVGSHLVPGSRMLATAGSWLHSRASELLRELLPAQESGEIIARTIHISSAILAAASPVMKELLEQQPPDKDHGTASAAKQKYGERHVVILHVQPDQVAATVAVVRHAFSGSLAPFSSGSDAVRVLLAAERLQATECAELCLHHLEAAGALDWDAALVLLRQEHCVQARRRQGAGLGGSGMVPGGSTGLSVGAAAVVASPAEPLPSASPRLAPLLARAQDLVQQQFEDLEVVWASPEARKRLMGLPHDALRALLAHPHLKVAYENTVMLAAASWLAHNAVQPHQAPVAVPCQPATTAALHKAPQAHELHGWMAQRQQQRLPAGAAEIDSSGRAASEGPAVPQQQHSQQEHAAKQAPMESSVDDVRNTLDAKQGLPDSVPHEQQRQQQQQEEEVETAAQGPVSEAGSAGFEDACDEAVPGPLWREQEITAAEPGEQPQQRLLEQGQRQKHKQQPQPQEGEKDCGDVGLADPKSMLEDLCMDAVRMPLLSYTYLLHVLPRLPPLQHHPELVSALQMDALQFQAATAQRQAHIAAAAAAGPAAASRYGRRPASERSVLDFCYSFAPEELSSRGLPLLPLHPQVLGLGRSSRAAGMAWGGGQGKQLPREQQPFLVSDDHYFGGFVWSLVVRRDGFVGVCWRVAQVAGCQVQLEGTPGAEVGTAFAISALTEAQQRAGSQAEAAAASGKGTHMHVYEGVQFVPPNTVWGFDDFWQPHGMEHFRDADGLVTLRCVLSYVD